MPPPGASPAAFSPLARPAVLGALVLLLVALVHGRTLGFAPLEVSDAELVGRGSLTAAWNAGGPAGLGLELEGSASASRAVNLLLHAGSSLLALVLALRLGLPPAGALLAAALFALHPLRVEPVAWLSQRAMLLSAFLALLALLAFLAGSRRSRLVGGFLALLAVAVAWPWPELTPGPSLAQRLASLPLALAALARTWGLPLDLGPSHPHPALDGSGLSAALLLAAWLALLVLVAALFRLRRRARLPANALLAFLGLASARLLVAPGEGLFRETDGYLAALGLELALAATLVRVLPRPAGLLAVLLLVGAAGLASARRVEAWSSEPELWSRVLARSPEDARAHDALGLWHLAHGRLSEAQRAQERALAARPQDALTRLHRGELELRRALLPGHEAHLVAAERELTRCLEVPNASARFQARVAARLGEVHQRAGDLARAATELERALALDPSDATAWARLGMVRLRGPSLAQAREAFQQASRRAPRTVDGWCGLGIIAFQESDLATATACLERALALEPDHVESRATLGRIQELGGDARRAETSYRRALGVNPDNADALYALGALLAREGRGEEALRYLDRVVSLARERPHVRASLESARLRMERGEVELPRQLLRAVLAFNPAQAEARALLEALEARTDGR